MIDTVLLDLDDTILDFHKSEAFALKKTLEELGIEPLSSTIERNCWSLERLQESRF